MLISTYALCGFSNFASIGIQVGALSAMAPLRRKDIAVVALRSMIAGNVACLMTACIAGIQTTSSSAYVILFTRRLVISKVSLKIIYLFKLQC